MFLSVRIGFLAILPNVLPILIFFGVMGALGVQLNIGTSLIAAIALGIAIDSTIHYMARLNQELRGETDQQAAITRALRRWARRSSTPRSRSRSASSRSRSRASCRSRTSGASPASPWRRPSAPTWSCCRRCWRQFKIITLWDLLGVRLGDEPAHTIPLFAGLRASQARVVVLMGDLKRFQPGEFIVRRGERGAEMYVVIQGRAEVWIGGEPAVGASST